MYELGLAVDFTCDGSLVACGDRCFHWLADHVIAIAVWVDGGGASASWRDPSRGLSGSLCMRA
jgi:hypothetical protein